MFLSDDKTGMFSKIGKESIEKLSMLKNKEKILDGKTVFNSTKNSKINFNKKLTENKYLNKKLEFVLKNKVINKSKDTTKVIPNYFPKYEYVLKKTVRNIFFNKNNNFESNITKYNKAKENYKTEKLLKLKLDNSLSKKDVKQQKIVNKKNKRKKFQKKSLKNIKHNENIINNNFLINTNLNSIDKMNLKTQDNYKFNKYLISKESLLSDNKQIKNNIFRFNSSFSNNVKTQKNINIINNKYEFSASPIKYKIKGFKFKEANNNINKFCKKHEPLVQDYYPNYSQIRPNPKSVIKFNKSLSRKTINTDFNATYYTKCNDLYYNIEKSYEYLENKNKIHINSNVDIKNNVLPSDFKIKSFNKALNNKNTYYNLNNLNKELNISKSEKLFLKEKNKTLLRTDSLNKNNRYRSKCLYYNPLSNIKDKLVLVNTINYFNNNKTNIILTHNLSNQNIKLSNNDNQIKYRSTEGKNFNNLVLNHILKHKNYYNIFNKSYKLTTIV